MQKKTFLAIILSLLVLITYPYIIAKLFPQYVSSVSKEEKEIIIPEGNRNLTALSEKSSLPIFSLESEKENVFENNNFRIVFTNYGGAIKEIELKKYKLNDQPLMLVKSEEREQDVFTIGSTSSIFKDRNIIYKKKSSFGNTIIYTANLEHSRITKEYFIPPEGYGIRLKLIIENLNSQPQLFNYSLNLSSPISKNNISRRLSEIYIANGDILRKNITTLKKEYTKRGNFSLAGINKRYFCLILKCLPKNLSINRISEIKASLSSQKQPECLLLNVGIKPFILHSQQRIEQEFILYAGPKDTEQLAAVDKDLSKIINYGFFSGISKIILTALKFFYKIGHNYGLAIILLAMAISLLLQPLTLKGFKSMKNMQKIQPHLNSLREQHKNDQQKLMQETRNLFRKHNVNPLGGCMPMLLQIPIFIALYQGLLRSLELRGAKFIFWIKDLSQTDALPLTFSLPLIGNKINVLPILMAIAMGWQQKLSTGQMSTAQNAQVSGMERQQKKMSLIMPFVFALIFYNMPSGLVLYWLVNTLITIFCQRRIR